jgi:glycogen debranching enzyme
VQADTEEIRVAAESCRYSLACLQENHGLFAGFPWFHQRWARDELVSVKGLLLSGQKSLAKVILFSWLDKIMPDGSLPGVLSPKIADGAWIFVRFMDYLKSASLTQTERAFLLAKLDAFLRHVQNGFIVSDAKATWMDSIDRQGARIEIQALALAACKLAKMLKKPVEFESDCKELVKQAFLEGGRLKDGANDSTIRPNIFIAAYVYPELLPKREWIKCFDAVLPKLWLDWGGLSTIDVSDSRFCKEHTGENSKSYHNGDSWFWINNLAAIVLARFDRERYKDHIGHILKASTDEILYHGACGHHAELSSAIEMRSQGCLAQAWSAAMYVELIDELFSK